MAMQQILRLPRTDKTSEHVLLNITKTGSRGLDLKLIGTDQEHLYHAQIKESDIKNLQTSNYGGNLEEWKTILSYLLLHEREEGLLPEVLHGLEIVAAISGETVTITLRKNIKGITQRLGVIKLDVDDEREEVSAFEWVDVAVAASDGLQTQLDELQASMTSQQEQVTKLSAQLDDLVKAKKEHEDELLAKFAALLNAKKLKIRDQQRLLAGAKIDPKVEASVREARSGDRSSQQPGPSRPKKRKPGETAETSERGDDTVMTLEEDDESDGDDNDDDANSSVQEETPQPSDDEGRDAENKGVYEQLDRGYLAPNEKGVSKTSNDMEIDDIGELPSRRNLPFNRKTHSSAKQATSASDSKVTQAEDDDETDDEL